MIYIVGHKNPDTDTVSASIALAELKNKQGEGAEACIQGKLSPETEFVLNQFGIAAPEILANAKDKDIFLVDHSDSSQTIDNLDPSRLKGIIDHHKLGDITSTNPLEMWVWPVGSTCTILKYMFDYYQLNPSKEIAGLMLGAILSDTVIFKSNTCTRKDKDAANDLAKIAGVEDIEKFGMDMFKAKSEIDNATPKELLLRDYKDFNMSGKKVGIGQLEMVDISLVEPLKSDLIKEMETLKEEGRHSVFLLLTDIMKEGSELVVVSDNEEVIQKAFGVEPVNKTAWLEDIMSRKKQVVPNLENSFEDL
ncbi:MAG: manganese-dependent inorganic pyrophosphatase [Nanobdellota archaeon]